MAIKTEDIQNGFVYETKIAVFQENISKATISLPFKKVRDMELKNKKLKVTIEVLED